MSFTIYLLSIVKASHITQKSAFTLYSSILISFLRNSKKSLLVFPPRGCLVFIFCVSFMFNDFSRVFYICHKAPVIESYPKVFTEKILSAL